MSAKEYPPLCVEGVAQDEEEWLAEELEDLDDDMRRAVESHDDPKLVAIGDVLEDVESLRHFRVLFIDGGHYWLMPMSDKQGWPINRQGDPSEHVSDKVFRRYVPSTAPRVTERMQVKGAKLYDRFRELFLNPRRLLTRAGRGAMLERFRDLFPNSSTKTFYKLVRAFLVGGCTSLALGGVVAKSHFDKIDLTKLEGMSLEYAIKHVKEKADKLVLLGAPEPNLEDHTVEGTPLRKAAAFEPTRYRVDEPTLCVFLHYVRHHYLADAAITQEDTYKVILQKVFATKTATDTVVELPAWAVPSLATFQYWLRTLTGFAERFIAKYGIDAWNLEQRPRTGTATTRSFQPGLVGEIDATVWNVNIRSDDGSGRLLGPPIVFRIRCRDTGVPLGIGVSLESASWLGAASAIRSCYLDKVELARQFGVKNIPAGIWPVLGSPTELVCDRGELFNHKSDPFILLTGVIVTVLPRKRGDLKPGVEGDWNVLQVSMVNMTAKAIINMHQKQSGARWDMSTSVLTMSEFKRKLMRLELRKLVTARKNFTPIPEFSHVSSAPLATWNAMRAVSGCALSMRHHELVPFALLERSKGSITEAGVVFRGLVYKAAKLPPDVTLARLRNGKAIPVHIAYDPRLVDVVMLLLGNDPNRPHEYIECVLNVEIRPRQQGYWGKCWREVRMLRLSHKQATADFAKEVKTLVEELDKEQLEEEAAAIQKTQAARAAHPMSQKALKAGQPAARLQAKNEQAPALAFTAPIAEQHKEEREAAEARTPSGVSLEGRLSKTSRLERLAAAHEADSAPEAT